MIPILMGTLFIVIVFGLFWYIFRGMRDDEQNPVWGNLFAAAVNTMLCVFLVYAFLNGNIADMSVIQNASYTINYGGLDSDTAATIAKNITTEHQYILGSNGGGMYTVSAMDTMNNASPYYKNLTVTYSMRDIVYLQIREVALAYFFGFLAVCNFAMFGWFMYSVLMSLFGRGEGEAQHEDGSEPAEVYDEGQ